MFAMPVTALYSCLEDKAVQGICAFVLERILRAVQLTHFFFERKKQKTQNNAGERTKMGHHLSSGKNLSLWFSWVSGLGPEGL